MNSVAPATIWKSEKVVNRTRLRKKSEKRFQLYGVLSVGFAAMILVILFASIFYRGFGSFTKTQILIPVKLEGTSNQTGEINHVKIVRDGLHSMFPNVKDAGEIKRLNLLLSQVAEYDLKKYITAKSVECLDEALAEDPAKRGEAVAGGESPTKQINRAVSKTHCSDVWVTASPIADLYVKNQVSLATPEHERNISDKQIEWIEKLKKEKRIKRTFNTEFFSLADSRRAEFAGIMGGVVGSLMTVFVCLLVSLPIGVLTAVYLQEFAKKTKLVEMIELNINNLAAVPSIIFGLLGLILYINFFELPRSSSVVGGLTLSMMIMPTIIISTRAALAAVPDSIRDAARAVGASELQVVFHHVLPLAVPGVMTGVILGIARSLGETAPLLMIGMVAFIVDIPTGILEPATTMPVQIFLWADNPQAAFAEKTAGCIVVLLMVLLALNSMAIYIRRRFERRW